MSWQLIKSKKETPCCYQQVRVKIVEPGVQARKCDICRETSFFILEPSTMFPDRLRFRWLTDGEAERVNTVDGELSIEDL